MSARQRLALRVGQVFSPAAPIDKLALFAGRTKQLRTVVDAINQRGQHVIIYGERGVGKTSLANVLAENIQVPGGSAVAPHVNCDSADDYSSIWRKVFSQIEMIQQGREAGFQGNLFQRPTNFADGMPEELDSADVRRALTILAQQHLVLVIIDEFDRLREEKIRTSFADTAKMLSDQSVPATLVLVGVSDTVNDLLREHQSIERSLVQVPMQRMSMPELYEIIDKGLAELEMSIDPTARDRIATLSRGLPHYTHLLARHSARAALDSGELKIGADDVESAIREALDQAQQSILTSYHKATTSQQPDALYSRVLLACALAKTDEMGYFAAADVREPMSRIMGRAYDIPNYARHLNEFCSDSRGPVLEKQGEPRRYRYRFRTPLMQPYVVLHGYADGLIQSIDAPQEGSS